MIADSVSSGVLTSAVTVKGIACEDEWRLDFRLRDDNLACRIWHLALLDCFVRQHTGLLEVSVSERCCARQLREAWA